MSQLGRLGPDGPEIRLPFYSQDRTSPTRPAMSVSCRFCCKSRLLAMDRSAISLRTTGFDPPALTLST
jgi:hypothetical protein